LEWLLCYMPLPRPNFGELLPSLPSTGIAHLPPAQEIVWSPLMALELLRERNITGKNLTWESLLPSRTTEAASEAAFSFEWVRMAIPTSAAAKDGASFIPSPT
jgi:hypothetical protein